jgi:hypothetical protein
MHILNNQVHITRKPIINIHVALKCCLFTFVQTDLDPRVLGRAMEENPELARQLRLAWEMHQQDQNEGFTVST